MRDNNLPLSLYKNIKQSGKVLFQSSAAEQIIKIHFGRLVWFCDQCLVFERLQLQYTFNV